MLLPQALCDTWSWVRWDHAGRPHRSEAQADEEYEAAVEEMHALLAAGRPLDELQRVAGGQMMYSNYRMEVIDPLLGTKAIDTTVQVRPGETISFEDLCTQNFKCPMTYISAILVSNLHTVCLCIAKS